MADLEQQLRELLRQPEPASWPDETNAYDHFLRRRARRARAAVTGAGPGSGRHPKVDLRVESLGAVREYPKG